MNLKSKLISINIPQRQLSIVLTYVLLITLITLAALITLPLASRAQSSAVSGDDFIIPTPLANPQTADEDFFNKRFEFLATCGY